MELRYSAEFHSHTHLLRAGETMAGMGRKDKFRQMKRVVVRVKDLRFSFLEGPLTDNELTGRK